MIGNLLPGLPHISTPMLVLIGFLVWIFWPKIKAALNPTTTVGASEAKTDLLPMLAPRIEPSPIRPPAQDVNGLKAVIAERNRLQGVVDQTLAEMRAVIDAETKPKQP